MSKADEVILLIAAATDYQGFAGRQTKDPIAATLKDLNEAAGQSYVALRNAVMNLAVIRRAVVSVAVDWIRRQPNRRQASLSGCYDFMTSRNSPMAFKLVTASKHLRLSNL